MRAFRYRTELLALTTVFFTEWAYAQQVTHSTSKVTEAIDNWTEQTGVVVTQEVREQIARDLANQFETDAPKVGLNQADSRRLGSVIAAGGTVEYSAEGKSKTVRGRNDRGAVTYASVLPPPRRKADQYDSEKVWSSFLGSFDFKIFSVLISYPQIHVLVQPVPPRDYLVRVNGRTYASTEEGLYGVRADELVMVRVERMGKPPCDWSGTVPSGQIMSVKCDL
jgi:hypothetical protein